MTVDSRLQVKVAMLPVRLAGRQVGKGAPVFVIAEAGVNHNGDVELARQLVDVAAAASADAVKFQTFRADRVASVHAPKAAYQVDITDAAETQLEMLRRLELSPEDHREIQSHCDELGVIFLSTPFDEESVDLLDSLGMPAFKVGSGEITNLPFLEYVARKGKPVILSTGMADLVEVEEAVRVIRRVGNEQVVLLHCVSNYPANPADANLRAMQTLAAAFGTPVGYSDHTAGVEVALAAVALGAAVIEKHFTIDRGQPGPDQRASLEPAELQVLVRGIRIVEAALGSGRKVPAASELSNRTIVRRSVAAASEIPAGTILLRQMLTALRPGSGISPARLDSVVGRRVKHDLRPGQLLSWDDLE